MLIWNEFYLELELTFSQEPVLNSGSCFDTSAVLQISEACVSVQHLPFYLKLHCFFFSLL